MTTSTSRLAATLMTEGVVVVDTGITHLDVERNRMLQTMRHFPEYRPHFNHRRYKWSHSYRDRKTKEMMTSVKSPLPQWVGGGFSALGNPASFHNPFVRDVRERCMAAAIPVFKHLLKRSVRSDPTRKAYNLEQVMDRMLFRPRGEKATKEAWHRDTTPSAHTDDMTFGGWINLDDESQTFSCAPRTHKLFCGQTDQSGFSKLGAEEAKQYSEIKTSISIPPGHLMIFFENLIHEVCAVKKTYDIYRVFTGWRLTKSNEPLHGSAMQRARMDSQAVMPLKSNQNPRMWPKLWLVNFWDRLVKWSQATFKDSVLVPTTRKGQEERVVPAVLESLRVMDLPMYPAYKSRERVMYWPMSSWSLMNAKTGRRTRYTLHDE